MALRSSLHAMSVEAHRKRKECGFDPIEGAQLVSCKTHKMRVRVNRRSGGWLVACNSAGFVLDAMEVFGGESLTQRAAFLARCVAGYPSLEAAVRDDACHLPRFVRKWLANENRLHYPSLRFIVDKFHARGHVDLLCRSNCFPGTPENQK